ncbi:Uridylate kinase [Clarias magur]|uniref:Uridylate kinase n=1 Tax=Clarias magur TaxID=1594786 RepID=A0A8J4XDR4_CLAMG|nr:Uridylate kinase [Clarias magur]
MDMMRMKEDMFPLKLTCLSTLQTGLGAGESARGMERLTGRHWANAEWQSIMPRRITLCPLAPHL